MNAYKVVLRYVDALRGDINLEGDWNEDAMDAKVLTIEMIDPESIL